MIFSSRVNRAIIILSSLFLFACVLRGFSLQTGFSHLIMFGDSWSAKRHLQVDPRQTHIRSNCSGYDGQFFAQIALNPSLNDPQFESVLDNPEYRAHKILLPLVAYVLGMGQSFWILQIYALLNLFFWGWLFWLLVRFIRPQTLFDWCCILVGILFSTGTLESIRRALTDLPSAVFGLLMVILISQGKRLASVWAFAAAIFTKELMILSGCVGLYTFQWKKKESYGLPLLFFCPLALFIGWVLYLKYGLGLSSVDISHSKQFGIPIFTMIKMACELFSKASIGDRFDYYFIIPAIVALSTQAIYFLKTLRWHDPFWLYGVGFAVLFFFLGEAIWLEPRAAFRVVLPMTLAFHVMLMQTNGIERWIWFILGNLHFPYAIINILTYRI